MLITNYQEKKYELTILKIPKNNTSNLPGVDVNIDKCKKRMKLLKDKVSISLPLMKKNI